MGLFNRGQAASALILDGKRAVRAYLGEQLVWDGTMDAFVPIPHILVSATMADPVVSATALTAAPFITASAQVHEPSISGTATVRPETAILVTGAVYVPDVSADALIEVPAISVSAIVLAPTVSEAFDTTVEAPFIQVTAGMYSPKITADYAAAVPIIAAFAELLAPLVTATGTAVVNAPMIAVSGSMFAPAVVGSSSVAAPMILASASVLAPEVRRDAKVFAPPIAGSAQVSAPSVTTYPAPDFVYFSPNITTSLSVAQPSGGWPNITIAAIFNSPMPGGDIFGATSDVWLKIESQSGKPAALAGNGEAFGAWPMNNNQVAQSRNQMIVTRTLTSMRSVVNGTPAELTGRSNSPLNQVMQVKSSNSNLKAVALWNRALSSSEQTAALAWLNTQAPA